MMGSWGGGGGGRGRGYTTPSVHTDCSDQHKVSICLPFFDVHSSAHIY